MNEILSPDDEELLKFIENSKPKIYIIGTGGSGSNTINRLFSIGVQGSDLIAMNTDAPHLVRTKADRKLLLGKKLTKGLGAGSDIKIGEQAAHESKEEIKHLISDAQLVFITCGLGGGTGTGSASVISHVAKELGALTIAIVTLPFSSEGNTRMQNAIEGLNKLKREVDSLIIIRNDKLLSIASDLPLNMAFRVSDEILASASKGIVEMVTKPGMVNIDFADLKAALKDSGYSVIGNGEGLATSRETNHAHIALENAINSPLLDVDLSNAGKALINIVGGENLTLRQAESIFQDVASRINSKAVLKWGARIEPDIQKDLIKVMIVVSGVDFPEYNTASSSDKEIDLDEIL